MSRDKAIAITRKFGGVFEEVEEGELMEAKTIADQAGVAVCPNSGVALAGLRKLRASGEIKDSDTVAVICTAHGAKFSQVVIDYHTGKLGAVAPHSPNAPVKVPAELDAVVRAMGLVP